MVHSRVALVCAACLLSPVAASADSAAPLSADEIEKISKSLSQDAAAEEDHATPPQTQASGSPPAASFLQSMNPDLSFILDTAGAYFSQDPLQLGAHDPNHTGFTLQQLELHVAANVDPFFRFESNIVFALFGVEVEEAYATSLSLPSNLQLRAGQFLTRFGRQNPTHPHSWSFADQPVVFGKFFGGEGNRGVGVEGSWLMPVPWYAEVVASATEAVGDCCARSYFGSDDLGVNGLEDLLYTTTLKQFFPLSSAWSFLFGLSAQFGPNASGFDNRTEIYGTDLFLRYRPVASAGRTSLNITAEALYRRRQVPGDVLADYGGYAMAVWQVDQNWETGVRYELTSGVESDPLDPTWTSMLRGASAQVTYYPSHFSRVRLQANLDDRSWLDERIYSAFLAFEINVGAHGAHNY